MTILRVDTLSGIGTNGPVFDGDFEFNSQNYVILPKGTTGDRVGVGSTPGALRYNTDSNKVELYDGSQWTEVQSSRPDLNGGARGVFAGGYTAPTSGNPPTLTLQNLIEYVNIASTGNSQDFGDLTVTRRDACSCSSSTRGVFSGGQVPSPNVLYNTIDYITYSSTGDATDFGDATIKPISSSGCSSSTRGIMFAGYAQPANANVNNIDYVTISSTGNAVKFGELYANAGALASACSSSTRGICCGGSPTSNLNVIQHITISTLGNSQDFGDLVSNLRNHSAVSNSYRGIIFGGYNNSPLASSINNIQYITIATLGNAVDFGDLSNTRLNGSAFSSQTRGVYGGGYSISPGPGGGNVMEYITIATAGNAVDFGDTQGSYRTTHTGTSNAHGGL
jgi:hypothetical protein